MNRILFSGTMTLALYSMLSFSPVNAEAANVTLKYANMFPPTHSQSKLAEEWIKAVEEKTAGRVKFEYYPGGTLLKGKQMFEGVVDGIADVGFSVAAYTAGRFPLVSAFDLPFGYPSGVVATKVVNDVYGKMKGADFKDAQLMYLHAHGPGFITTNGKEVKTLADMKGLRIRSTGMSAEMVKAIGGTPVAMEMGEAYESLQKGVVDGSAHPTEANLGWKLGEVIKTVTRCYPVSYTTTFFVVMNKDKWAAIDSKDQQAIQAINTEWQGKHGQAWDESDKVAMDDLNKKGVKIIDLEAKEGEAWAASVVPFINDFAAGMGKKGVDGAAAVKAIQEGIKAGK